MRLEGPSYWRETGENLTSRSRPVGYVRRLAQSGVFNFFVSWIRFIGLVVGAFYMFFKPDPSGRVLGPGLAPNRPNFYGFTTMCLFVTQYLDPQAELMASERLLNSGWLHHFLAGAACTAVANDGAKQETIPSGF